MRPTIDFRVSPTWAEHYRDQGMTVAEQIDFPCSLTWQGYYYETGLTAYRPAGREGRTDPLLPEIRALRGEVAALRTALDPINQRLQRVKAETRAAPSAAPPAEPPGRDDPPKASRTPRAPKGGVDL